MTTPIFVKRLRTSNADYVHSYEEARQAVETQLGRLEEEGIAAGRVWIEILVGDPQP